MKDSGFFVLYTTRLSTKETIISSLITFLVIDYTMYTNGNKTQRERI